MLPKLLALAAAFNRLRLLPLPAAAAGTTVPVVAALVALRWLPLRPRWKRSGSFADGVAAVRRPCGDSRAAASTTDGRKG
jgi:hypothetical protein